MSSRRNSFGNRSKNFNRQSETHNHADDSEIDLATKNDGSLNILPELMKNIRKLLPREFPLNMYVRQVEYIENQCEHLIGTLFMTTFRLVFVPDRETECNAFIISENKYIGEYDIPLASIYKIHVAPVDSRSGFKSFLNENQIQSETRTFTIITRDFRRVTFTKCSVTKSNTGTKQSSASVTNMETYINALRRHSQFQSKDQLYPYLAMQQSSSDVVSRDYTHDSLSNTRSVDDVTKDFSLSNDERVKSYLTYYDWRDELYEADEHDWIVDQKKFNKHYVVQEDGPYVCLAKNTDESLNDLIWHWTHTSQIGTDGPSRRPIEQQKHMLITVPNVADATTMEPPETPGSAPAVPQSSSSSSTPFRFSKIKKKLRKSLRPNTTDGPKLICTNETKTTTNDLPAMSEMVSDVGLRRAATDTSLVPSAHLIHDQPFQRYNLAKFPCSLKRLQTGYEKLFETCVLTIDDDDEKWWTKVGACKWLKYVSKALHGAASLAKLLDFKNIELAGSDTDNNCLISSLIQILLRPKCRTIKGFCELIVREWLIRGHKFRERFGQVLYEASGSSAQESPVFLLFLDCVYQLLRQNPLQFEFTEYFLLELYRSVCYCYHHTFVFNSISERVYAIYNCPRNLLVLSAFDFSLYLHPNASCLIRNYASVSSDQPKKSRIESPIYYPPSESPQRPARTVYYLERPKSTSSMSEVQLTNNFPLPIAEHYEYETIESPQSFPANLTVDWRVFNLELWPKCYCRYDQKYKPTYYEQCLSNDIDYFIENLAKKSQQAVTLDTYSYVCIFYTTLSKNRLLLFTFQIGYANSWHPQTLDTRV
ncbi:unnamed protein product [Adineta ricciae]|uniref:Myotubularin phosphatase domain-containing protein n=1 Tax=Adineta ricciae TaxID=249248 RepID=A0A814JC44_ADIRI|nr:unnamed protein product [Adineta ricciae]